MFKETIASLKASVVTGKGHPKIAYCTRKFKLEILDCMIEARQEQSSLKIPSFLDWLGGQQGEGAISTLGNSLQDLYKK